MGQLDSYSPLPVFGRERGGEEGGNWRERSGGNWREGSGREGQGEKWRERNEEREKEIERYVAVSLPE